MVGPGAKRAAVAQLRSDLHMSERRACSLIGADRMSVRYRARRPDDSQLRARLRELANQRRRFGYRRLFILLRRDGEMAGINRICRLYGKRAWPCADAATGAKPLARARPFSSRQG